MSDCNQLRNSQLANDIAREQYLASEKSAERASICAHIVFGITVILTAVRVVQYCLKD